MNFIHFLPNDFILAFLLQNNYNGIVFQLWCVAGAR